ncbi:MAG: uroporphyrinogen decarboxylase [Gammaproteobacteria bacterium]|nr:uroporphyrinogen decarboxylase [Gammaproteobacteria bacterium]
MNTSSEPLFLRALKREPVERTPVWLMRQAGRYLPEYMEVRKQAGSFMALASNPELACKVTLQPIERFGLDAAILFSDILTIPDAMGLGLYFAEGEGPRFTKPVRTEADIESLHEPEAGKDLGYVMEAIRLIRSKLDSDTPLIGFCGSPWTVATYMVEGGSSRNFENIKSMLYRQPQLMHRLLIKVANASCDYLQAQIEAGAQAVMIFDTWGGSLSTASYKEFSLAYMRHIVAHIKAHHNTRDTPVILFTKGGASWLEMIADTGCDAVGVDWTCDLAHARKRVGDRVALQGNLDPGVLYGNSTVVERECRRVLDSFGPGSGHVFNLGHGIHPGVDPQRVADLVAAVRQHSPALHR